MFARRAVKDFMKGCATICVPLPEHPVALRCALTCTGAEGHVEVFPQT